MTSGRDYDDICENVAKELDSLVRAAFDRIVRAFEVFDNLAPGLVEYKREDDGDGGSCYCWMVQFADKADKRGFIVQFNMYGYGTEEGDRICFGFSVYDFDIREVFNHDFGEAEEEQPLTEDEQAVSQYVRLVESFDPREMVEACKNHLLRRFRRR